MIITKKATGFNLPLAVQSPPGPTI